MCLRRKKHRSHGRHEHRVASHIPVGRIRCNVDQSQRVTWTNLALSASLPRDACIAVWLDTEIGEDKARHQYLCVFSSNNDGDGQFFLLMPRVRLSSLRRGCVSLFYVVVFCVGRGRENPELMHRSKRSACRRMAVMLLQSTTCGATLSRKFLEIILCARPFHV